VFAKSAKGAIGLFLLEACKQGARANLLPEGDLSASSTHPQGSLEAAVNGTFAHNTISPATNFVSGFGTSHWFMVKLEKAVFVKTIFLYQNVDQ